MQILSISSSLDYTIKIKLMEKIEKNPLDNYLNLEIEVVCSISSKPSGGMRPDPDEETVSGITMTSTFII